MRFPREAMLAFKWVEHRKTQLILSICNIHNLLCSAGSKHPKIWSRSTQRITADFWGKLLYNRLYLIHLHVAKI